MAGMGGISLPHRAETEAGGGGRTTTTIDFAAGGGQGTGALGPNIHTSRVRHFEDCGERSAPHKILKT